jgi:hypothetical protein
MCRTFGCTRTSERIWLVDGNMHVCKVMVATLLDYPDTSAAAVYCIALQYHALQCRRVTHSTVGLYPADVPNPTSLLAAAGDLKLTASPCSQLIHQSLQSCTSIQGARGQCSVGKETALRLRIDNMCELH